jgi:acetyl-CoA acetyltransferase
MPGSVIGDGVRPPIGRLSEALKDFKAVHLGSLAIKACIALHLGDELRRSSGGQGDALIIRVPA